MALPSLSLNAIKIKLQTQWGGDDEGTRFDWYNEDGQLDGSIHYALPDIELVGKGDVAENGFVMMTDSQKAFAREAFELWDDLIASSLIENTDINGQALLGYEEQISFGYSSSTKNGGTYTKPWTTDEPPGTSTFFHQYDHAKIWMSTSWDTLQSANMAYGAYGMETYVHEIGHSLGLSHPGSYDASDKIPPTYGKNAEYQQDTGQWTVMSYFRAGADGTKIDRDGLDLNGDGSPDYTYAATPLLHDIAAIQAKYGADMTTRTGDTNYGFNSNAGRGALDFAVNQNPVIAIWDAGGTDRLDASGFSQDQRIDLAEGGLSDIGALTLNVGIAYGVTIENAAGGSGNDEVTGNIASNVLEGNGGNDQLEGLGDADTLYGNSGNDTLAGGFGYTDQLYGGLGDDTYVADDLDDTYEYAGGGHDTVKSSVRWVLASEIEDLTLVGTADVNGFGNALDNHMRGNSGRNYLQGFAGLDLLQGGKGNDYYELGDRTFIDENSGYDWDTVLEFEGEGTDTVSITNVDGSFYFMTANVENLIDSGTTGMRASGNDLANVMTGNAGYNQFFGQDGDDRLNGGAAMDDLLGEKGNDIYVLDDRNRASQLALLAFDNVIEAADEGTDMVLVRSLDNPDTFGVDGYTLGANVENGTITGSDVFNLTGNELDNVLIGNGAANKLTGNDGDDRLNGAEGVDTLAGGQDDDIYVLADLARTGQLGVLQYDRVTELADGGIDQIIVTAIDNPDKFSTDTYVLGANIENGKIAGTEIFNLSGNGLGNILTGNRAANKLTGGEGNDELNGVLGIDTLIGGGGDDTYALTDINAAGKFATYRYDAIREAVDGGTDTLIITALDNPDTFRRDGYVLGENLENAILAGSMDFNLTGNELENTLSGNSFANTILGNDGSDTIRGQRGRDVIAGGRGADWISGGAGKDALAGDGGTDTFIFATGFDSDTISDFNARGAGHDIIDLSGLEAIKNFADLMAHHLAKKGADIIISASGGDMLTLSGIAPDDLDVRDFSF